MSRCRRLVWRASLAALTLMALAAAAGAPVGYSPS